MNFDKTLLDLVGKAIAIAAFLFTAFTYAYNLHLDRRNERYAEATALIERYAGIREHENQLATRLLYYGSELSDPAALPDDFFELAAKETFFGYTGDPENPTKPFLREFLEIMDFYARVSFCLDAQICDAAIVKRYFCPRAAAFATKYRRLIAYYQDYSGWKDWSDGLESLTTRCAV